MPIDQGKDLRRVLIIKANGKPIEGDPKSGAHTIAMNPALHVSFAGDRKDALKELKKSYPKCTFKWE